MEATQVPVRNTSTRIRVGGLTPQVTYQFRFRVDEPDKIPVYSTIITYTTPDIGQLCISHKAHTPLLTGDHFDIIFLIE